LTGQYPTCHGYTHKRYYLDNGDDSIASILQKNGYETVCFSNNMYLSDKSGLDAGFDNFYYRGVPQGEENQSGSTQKSGLIDRLKTLPSLRTKNLLKNVVDSFDHAKALTRDDGAYETEVAFQRWSLARSADKPFFSYIHYQEPHSIYFAPYPYRRRFFSGSWFEEGAYLEFDHMRYFAGKRGFTETQVKHYLELYDAEITYLDWRIGRLFDFLKKQHLYENTIIMVTADHGEMFGENDFFWHAFCLYEPLIRVPLLVRYPGWFEKDKRSSSIVQTTDIVPTLLEGLDIEWAHQKEKQGQSFLNGSRREAALVETYNPEPMIDRWLERNDDLKKADFSHYCRDLFAYRKLDGKLIKTSDNRPEFYDMKKDRHESRNLYNQQDIRIENFDKELAEWTGSFTPHVVSNDTQPGFDKTTWEKMKALGYA
jgi:arylsulfatase A-like enzyme